MTIKHWIESRKRLCDGAVEAAYREGHQAGRLYTFSASEGWQASDARAARTDLPKALRMLKVAVEALDEMSRREQGDPGEPASAALAQIAKEAEE